jgi:hypothetical protein
VPEDRVIAVLVSDLHLSDRAPSFRSVEKDWFACMERQLGELDRLAKSFRAVIVCAGDVFHRWDPSPNLINFALKYLPFMYAIPGQHDLRNHNYSDVQQTAYWTMVETGRIVNVKPGLPCAVEGALLHAFPWGFDITPCKTTRPIDGLNVAVIHKYVWVKGKGYPGAPDDARLRRLAPSLRGYDAAAVGDNHMGFLSSLGACAVLNCGGFMRRDSTQADYKPSCGLLRASGAIARHYFDVSQDRGLPVIKSDRVVEHQTGELRGFLESLRERPDERYDYEQVLRAFCASKRVSAAATEILLSALEGARR